MNVRTHRAPGRLPARLLLVAFLAAAGGVDAAYKWLDDQGNVHYTQSPPPDRPAEALELPPPPRNAADAQERLRRQVQQSDAYLREREQQARADAKLEQEAAQTREKCEWARRNLEQLQSVQRVYATDAQGNRMRVPEEQRQAQLEAARKQIEEFCQ
ncbi:MAG: DUF4124 domain-containing protein [Gammaproteobacteria bacterium]|nr:DUF4124 domain-containing protein [Gammaproteobacteria bacterium]